MNGIFILMASGRHPFFISYFPLFKRILDGEQKRKCFRKVCLFSSSLPLSGAACFNKPFESVVERKSISCAHQKLIISSFIPLLRRFLFILFLVYFMSLSFYWIYCSSFGRVSWLESFL